MEDAANRDNPDAPAPVGRLEAVTLTISRYIRLVLEKLMFIVGPIVAMILIKLIIWIYANPFIFGVMWFGLVLVGLMAEEAVDYNRRYPPDIYTGGNYSSVEMESVATATGGQRIGAEDEVYHPSTTSTSTDIDVENETEQVDELGIQQKLTSSTTRPQRSRTVPTAMSNAVLQGGSIIDQMYYFDYPSVKDVDEDTEFETPPETASCEDLSRIILKTRAHRARSYPATKRTKTNFTMKSHRVPDGYVVA